VALDTLHHARVDFDGLVGSATGVFIGGFMLDHHAGNGHFTVRERITNHSATSSMATMLSNRLSFTLGLQGPSLTLDTACSSSLVATHLACRALQAGDADMCLAGGVNYMLMANTIMMLCKGQFLAKDGRSKSFDASADGYGRGEGCGMVALKRLSDAKADGDDIISVIIGSGVNQDGATPGITVPSADAQAKLMQKVYANAEFSARDIDLFEAHGTGTPVGDPLEVKAMSKVLTAHGADQPIVLGSVKAGIGHQEAAAGVAGLLKASVSVRSGKVGPQAWLEELNPALNLDDSPLHVAQDAPAAIGGPGRPTVAVVNSFGYGGTNAHAVVASHV
jgi:acyl transferase domain-containing protein